MNRALVATMILSAGAIMLVGTGFVRAGDGPRATPQPRGNLTLSQAREFKEFALYFAGDSVQGQPLVAIKRMDAPELPGDTLRNNSVTFLYGLCQIEVGEHACASPLQVQIWPACERYQALYPFPPDEAFSVRGVPAALYENGARLELYTGKVTIVLFGQEKTQLLNMARALRGVNNPSDVKLSLPPPAAGAREGLVSC